LDKGEEMSIQIYQLLVLAVYAVLIYFIYRGIKKDKWIVAGICFWIGIILFFVNPVRFKQEGSAALERSISRFDEVPEKVEVKTENYNDFHKNQLETLKSESEERKDEVHN
jgi:hypothetical protein